MRIIFLLKKTARTSVKQTFNSCSLPLRCTVTMRPFTLVTTQRSLGLSSFTITRASVRFLWQTAIRQLCIKHCMRTVSRKHREIVYYTHNEKWRVKLKRRRLYTPCYGGTDMQCLHEQPGCVNLLSSKEGGFSCRIVFPKSRSVFSVSPQNRNTKTQ